MSYYTDQLCPPVNSLQDFLFLPAQEVGRDDAAQGSSLAGCLLPLPSAGVLVIPSCDAALKVDLEAAHVAQQVLQIESTWTPVMGGLLLLGAAHVVSIGSCDGKPAAFWGCKWMQHGLPLCRVSSLLSFAAPGRLLLEHS